MFLFNNLTDSTNNKPYRLQWHYHVKYPWHIYNLIDSIYDKPYHLHSVDYGEISRWHVFTLKDSPNHKPSPSTAWGKNYFSLEYRYCLDHFFSSLKSNSNSISEFSIVDWVKWVKKSHWIMWLSFGLKIELKKKPSSLKGR